MLRVPQPNAMKRTTLSVIMMSLSAKMKTDTKPVPKNERIWKPNTKPIFQQPENTQLHTDFKTPNTDFGCQFPHNRSSLPLNVFALVDCLFCYQPTFILIEICEKSKNQRANTKKIQKTSSEEYQIPTWCLAFLVYRKSRYPIDISSP